MAPFFVIVGGMGTIATTQFLSVMNERFHPKKDQDYLDYVLVNAASIPDRTAYILDHEQENPLESLAKIIHFYDQLHPSFFVLPCNTAHYFIKNLQAETSCPIVNMLELVHRELKENKSYHHKKIGILATEGTVKMGLYDPVFDETKAKLVYPNQALQEKITSFIYEDIKAKDDLNVKKFSALIDAFKAIGCEAVLAGCTEISFAHFALKKVSFSLPILDAEDLLIEETIKLGRKTQNK